MVRFQSAYKSHLLRQQEKVNLELRELVSRLVIILLVVNEKTIASIWHKNLLGHLSTVIICCKKRTVFQQHSSRRTVGFEEQIMSKDK